MKNALILLFLTLFLNACIPIKSVGNIDGFHVVQGNVKSNNEIKKLNKFIFQIHKDRKGFDRFLEEKFNTVIGFSPQYFSVMINDVNFNVSVLNKEETSKYIDFLDFIFKKNDPELVKNGETKQFVSITVTNDQGEDCLNVNSFYRYMVSNYLDDLRKGFNAY